MGTAQYTVSDFAHLLHRRTKGKLWLAISFLKLAAFYPFARKLHRTNAAGYHWSFPDFRTFAFLFREVFIKQEYVFDLPRPIIADCGANIGVSTLFFKKFHPQARIHCFEPLPGNFAYLKENVTRNGLKNVTLINAAVGAKDGEIDFYFDKDAPYILMASVKRQRGGKDRCIVPCIRLSQYIRKHKVNVLKMDIEGAEYDVFKDLAKTGALKQLRVILLECHHDPRRGDAFPRLLLTLKQNGFEYFLESALSVREVTQDVIVFARKIEK